MRGEVIGILRDAGGNPVWEVVASLAPTTPGRGHMVGFLKAVLSRELIFIEGAWNYQLSGGNRAIGAFEARIRVFGSAIDIGWLEGDFEDKLNFGSIGDFTGDWEICR